MFSTLLAKNLLISKYIFYVHMYNTHIKIIFTELGSWITTAIVILALDVAINVYGQSISSNMVRS